MTDHRDVTAAPSLTPLKRAFLALEEAERRVAELQQATREPVAIIGIGCRMPGGGDNPDLFWQMLRGGVDAIGPVPADRWDRDALYDPDPGAPGRIAARDGGFIRGIDQFDPEFFGIAPREAQSMDPQQRLLLEVAWEALEHAAQAPDRLKQTPTGVYVGITSSDYAYLQVKANDAGLFDSHFASGIAHSIVTGRLSYLLGLRGPSLTIDTACSSSLVAVHLACQALRAGDCQMALAGGVNVILSPDLYVALSHSRMLAADGRCKTFDAAADGFGRAEGCGVVVLKKLRDARAAGDRILAVILGSAVNQDGASSGLTAPSGPAQEAVIREALARADVAPDVVGYIEAHGTGTQLGDPLEVRALGAVFGEGRGRSRPLTLGSVKTNVGHLEAAAGITGLIKLVLALRHRLIPKHLHFDTPSPHIPWSDYPFRVPTAAEPWEPIAGRRVGGVSAFGFSGTNVHVVVEEAPTEDADAAPVTPVGEGHLLTLSAHDGKALAELAQRVARSVDGRPDGELRDVCYTANVGRARFTHRAAISATTIPELRERLIALADGRAVAGLDSAAVARRDPPRIAFVFTGQGAQYPGMARGLYSQWAAFRAALDRCAAVLAPHLDRPLLEVLFPADPKATPLDETAYTQPALFAIEYALSELWRSWGVVPDMVLGHSVGEYAAAHVAGVLSLEDALRLVSRRGGLMQALPPGGSMAAVFASEQRVREVLAPFMTDLAIATVNGPAQVVISGRASAVEAVSKCLAEQNIRCQPLAVSHAFHSPLIDPILDEFERYVETVQLRAPRLPLISNLTGNVVGATEVVKAKYWRRHVREAVRFGDGVLALHALRPDCVVEIGPHPTLLPFIGSPESEPAPQLVASLHKDRDDRQQMLLAAGTLFAAGVDIDWRGVERDHEHRIVDLPTYPFQRERSWFESTRPVPTATVGGRRSGHPLLGARLRTAASDIIFESVITADAPGFVRQHRVLDRVVLPATAFLDTLLAAAEQLHGGEAVALEDVTLSGAMVFHDVSRARTMQTICAAVRAGSSRASISSARFGGDDADEWVTHVTATLRGVASESPHHPTLPEARARCTESKAPQELYAALERRGLDFGRGFRTIQQLFCAGSSILAEVRLPEEFVADAAGYRIHPVLLDGCLQAIAGAVLVGPDDALYLPIGVERYRLSGRPSRTCWSYAVLRNAADAAAIRADIHVFDSGGAIVGELQGVQLKRVHRNALDNDERWLDAQLYDTHWPVTSPAETRSASPGSQLADAALRALPALRQTASLDAYDAFLPQFEAICADYVVQTMQRLEWSPVAGEYFDPAELARELRVAGRHARLFERLLTILAEVGIVEREPRGWRVRRPLPAVRPAERLAQLARSCPPGAEAELEMTARTAGLFAAALRGEHEPMQLLFPDGSTANAERLYRDSPTARFFNGMVAEVIAAAVTALPQDRTLRILEVGAGTGGTSSHVVARLPRGRVEYSFTDVGATFVARARNRFDQIAGMRFHTLDLEREPEEQGVQAGAFDIVIAANVVHATSDVRQTLQRIRRLLAPGGLLAMLEVTDAQRWFDLTVGLTDGWWRFADRDLRTDYPTLSRDRWHTVLAECGFESAVALPSDDVRTGCAARQALFVARTGSLTASAAIPNEWLILADRRGVGAALAERLRADGARCTLIHADVSRRSGEFSIDPVSAADYHRVLSDAQSRGCAPHGVVHAWSLDAEPWDGTTVSRLASAESHGAVSAMLMAQALVAETPGTRLWILTSGAQQVGAQDTRLSPVQAGVWGLGKSLAIEHPELRCVCVDLTPGDELADIEPLVAEFNEPGVETQIALRRGRRHAARLMRTRRTPSPDHRDSPGTPYRLVPETAGSIDRFVRHPIVRRGAGRGEVEIDVQATGLNFKDVLGALGMYPGDPGPLGSECAGRVMTVGEDVTHLQPGDEVIAVAGGSFASHVLAPAALVQRRPVGMSAEEGAACPVAFLTARFCLDHLASLKRGERVLIHAATGGVGMAAVQIAQRLGAEVFATAGAEWKRDLLRAMGVRQVMDSRTPSFADAILEATCGEGVEVVLNALSGQLVDASFRALARGGRFVEIGKRGIKDEASVRALGRGHEYHIVDWGQTAARHPQLIGTMLADLVRDIGSGALTPLPRQVFFVDDVARAFRFMAKARHVGKIVVQQHRSAAAPIRRDATYLVTGGLSGLGLAAARWLAERGAGRLVLVGRRGPTEESAPIVAELRARGCTVLAESLDVTDEPRVVELLARIRRHGPPLRGVVHGAGILDDAALSQQNVNRFARVLAPKVHGAYLLDRATRIDPLDFFVLFSSAAAVLGSPGQSNHAAANAILDALARERANQGRPALSINWGPWSEIGAAADRGITERLVAEGLGALSPAQGLTALERLLQSTAPQVAVLPIDWNRFLPHAPALARSPFLTGVGRASEAPAPTPKALQSPDPSVRQQVLEAPAGRRRAIVETLVREHARSVLGIGPARAIDLSTPLGDLGLDSLLAIELRNALARSLEATFPATLVFDCPTVNALTDYVLSDVFGIRPSAAPDNKAPGSLIDAIEDLADDEVDRMLAARAGARSGHEQ